VGVAIIINQQACPQWAVIGKPRLVGGPCCALCGFTLVPASANHVGGPARETPNPEPFFHFNAAEFSAAVFARLL